MNGSAEADVHIVRSISAGTYHRASASGFDYQNRELDRYPSVVFIGPSGSTRNRFIYITDEVIRSSEYRVYFNTVNIAEELLEATAIAAGQAIFESFLEELFGLEGNDGGDNAMMSRAVGLGLSILQRDNVLAVGVDAVINEIGLALQREFPNNRFIVLAGTNFFGSVLQQLYGPAFRLMSRG